MVMLLEGLNSIRDLHGAQIENGIVGTDGTAPLESQTGLITSVPASELTVTIVKSSKTNTINYTLPSTTATGNTYREFGTRNNTNSIDYDRVTFTGVAHTANDDLIVRKIIYYRNPE